MNFNPSTIKSSEGIFINYKYSKPSYEFTQNEETTSENSNNTNIIVSFYFWMQNSLLCYERNYERLQDLLSKIGGIKSCIRIIGSIINSFVVNYIILLDTEELVLNTDKQNYKNCHDINLKPTILD